MGVNVSKYIDLKSSSNLVVAKIGSAFVVSAKRYNPETGAAQSDELIAVDLNQLLEQKIRLEADLANLNALIADLQKL